MTDKLKQSIQKSLESKQLNQQQLDQLDGLMRSTSKNSDRPPLLAFNILAAAFVLTVVISVLALVEIRKEQVDVAELIAEEVAYNHLKMNPVEVSSTSLDDLRNYFTKLDFSISRSQFVIDNQLRLIGGRYCSIQGGAAAQLRMQDEQTGAIQIVYQAPYNKELFRDLPNLNDGEEPVRRFINGIAVDIWVEQGVLFARSFQQ